MNCRKHIESIISVQAAKEGLVVVDFDSNQSRDHFISQLRKQISLALSEKPGDHEYFYELINLLDTVLVGEENRKIFNNEIKFWFDYAAEIIQNKKWNYKNLEHLYSISHVLGYLGHKVENIKDFSSTVKIFDLLTNLNNASIPPNTTGKYFFSLIKSDLFRFFANIADSSDWKYLIEKTEKIFSEKQISDSKEKGAFFGHIDFSFIIRKAVWSDPGLINFVLTRNSDSLDDKIKGVISALRGVETDELVKEFAKNIETLRKIEKENNISDDVRRLLQETITNFENKNKIKKIKIEDLDIE